MEKYSLTSLKQIGNSEKKKPSNGAIILINRQNYNHENEKVKTNKSFTKPIKYNILSAKQKPISDNKSNIKYFLSDNQKPEFLKGNNLRDNITIAKSQRIFNFFFKKNIL